MGGKKLNRFFVLLSAAGMAWVALSLVNLLDPPGSFSSYPLPSIREPLESFTSQQLSHEGINETLLIDSILSIVQDHYVDEDRTEDGKLLRFTLDFLSENNPNVTIAKMDGGWEVAIGTKILRVPVAKNYFSTLRSLVSISQVLSSQEEEERSSGSRLEKLGVGSFTVLNAMLNTLDPHSSILDQQSYRDLRQGTEGSFGGLGVLVGVRDRLLTVIKPIPNSPAFRAGIKRRDRITSINGVDTFGFKLDDLVEHMRGDPGTDVDITLLREGASSPYEMMLTREIIQVDSVSSQRIEINQHNFVKIKIENFASRTSQELLQHITEAREKFNQKLHGVVLDLRSNPGGLLDQAVQVTDLFLDKGVIVSTKGRKKEVEHADNGYENHDFPIIILVDRDTASASEIVAGALQDHKRAVVIGQPSFGKGSVQTIFELPGEQALKLTVARYYTPSGRSIQNIGITPDIWLQPVYQVKSKENSNLLGSHRYMNERYLRNSLDQKSSKSLTSSFMKGYYLSEEEPGLFSKKSEEDVELQMALMILSKLVRTYGDKLPPGANRSSHWLSLTFEELQKEVAQRNLLVNSMLKKHHEIDWTQGATSPEKSGISLKLNSKNIENVGAGEAFKIAWTLTNDLSVDIGRVSLFTRSRGNPSVASELLVGFLPGKSSRSGVISLKAPNDLEGEVLKVNVRMALDAIPYDQIMEVVKIDVVKREYLSLRASTNFYDDQKKSLPGILEPGEEAELEVIIENYGLEPALNVVASLVNLSGSQVVILDESLKVSHLASNQSIRHRFSIKANSKINISSVKLGVEVLADELSEPVLKAVSIPSQPDLNFKRLTNLLGH